MPARVRPCYQDDAMPELPWIFTRLDLRSLVDIFAVALIFFWLLWVVQGTRATQLIRGLAILLILVIGVANIFSLTALNWILGHALPALIIAVPIVFQPELRRALEQIGHIRIPGTSSEVNAKQVQVIEHIIRASSQLSRLRFGGLIVIQRQTGLDNYVEQGVKLNADVTRQLLINIFYPNSPLHDGAVIIHGERILAASCVLPLSENVAVGGQLGTRHRAGIGITEESDAIAVIISEETGQISVAHSEGRLARNLDQERLRRVLYALLRIERSEGSERQTRRRPERETTETREEGSDEARRTDDVSKNPSSVG
jgi:diadenylate cyclase